MKDYANLSEVPYPQKDLETVPYWLNGLLPLAYQLNYSHLLNVSHGYISAILDRQEPDGWAGPDEPDSSCTIGCRSPWPRYRLLTVLARLAGAARTVDPGQQHHGGAAAVAERNARRAGMPPCLVAKV